MARQAYQDRLQVFPFYLMDIGPMEALSLPIFTPLFGFSSITAPEITVETQDIVEGNWLYSTKVVKRASVGTFSCTRGATFFDSDFYRWVQAAVHGDTEFFQSKGYGAAIGLATAQGVASAAAGTAVGALGGLFGFPRIGGPSYRRDLLLVQTFARSQGTALGGSEALSEINSQIANLGIGLVSLVATGSIATGLANGAAAFAGEGAFAGIPARAWMLRGCIPTRYKASADFDATSSEVSMMELDFEVDHFEEISLSA